MSKEGDWRPLASIEIIQQRARLLQQVREFMHERKILEVDTPIISQSGISDPYIQSLKLPKENKDYFLHTSPEYCMKRLLSAGTGSIYQICRVFRDDESGKQHLMEFSMLEWYRVGFDYHQLMDELIELLAQLEQEKPKKMTYQQVFEQVLEIDPHTISIDTLVELANTNGWNTKTEDRHELLDFLFSSVVMKHSDLQKPVIIYDYPECMAALATLKETEPGLSERFELFIKGMEIANGFNELTDANEQRQRFESELSERKQKGLPIYPMDHHFIDALVNGMPESAGVALGIDRLLMILLEKDDINVTNTFTLLNN